MKEIDEMLEYLTKLTKEEADLIDHVLSWTDEYRMAYKFAKKMFDEDLKKKRKKKDETNN